MKKISLLALFCGLFLSVLRADLVHNFENQRFNGNRYEVLGDQPGNLQKFTVIVRLESDVIKNGLYAWALRCNDVQGKLQWAFYRAGWNNNFGFYLNCQPKPIFVHLPLGNFTNGLHSVAAVVTPEDVKLYCDGKLLKTEALAARKYSFTTLPGKIFAGAADVKKTDGFFGNIEQIQFRDRAFTAKEVEYAKTYIKMMHPNSIIIALDAAVGSSEDIGLIKIQNKGIKPGLGVNKDLGVVGDIGLIGIVAEKSIKNYNLFNLTRLNLVYKMAEKIADGIENYLIYINNLQSKNYA